MPVLDIGGNGNDHARRKADGRLAFFLIPALARRADQQLPAALRGMIPIAVMMRYLPTIREDWRLSRTQCVCGMYLQRCPAF